MIKCEAVGDFGVPNEQVRDKIKPLALRDNKSVWQLNGDWAIVKGEQYEIDESLKEDLEAKYPKDWHEEEKKGKPRGLGAYFNPVKSQDSAVKVSGSKKVENDK